MKRLPPVPLGDDRVALRQGDRLPGLLLRIVDAFGKPFDLTGYTCTLVTRRISGQVHTNSGWGAGREVQIRDAVEGLIFYDMQAADTQTPPGEFELIARLYRDGALITTAPTKPETYIEVNSGVPGFVVNPLEPSEFMP